MLRHSPVNYSETFTGKIPKDVLPADEAIFVVQNDVQLNQVYFVYHHLPVLGDVAESQHQDKSFHSTHPPMIAPQISVMRASDAIQHP